MSQIVARNVTYDYADTRALDDVGFSIAGGSITAMVGPNGAGKTTLLRCLAALERPHAGSVEIDGLDVSEHPRAVHTRLGYLSDNFGLYEDLTVQQCLTYHAAIHDLPKARQKEAIERAAERMDLVELLKKRSGNMSRGQKQRLGIAQAIVHEPKVVLLDEPASGLDPEQRWKLSSLLAGMGREGMTLIVSSHILSELEDYSTDVLIIRDGRIALHRPLQEAVKAVEAGLVDGDAGDADASRAVVCLRIELTQDTPRFEAVLREFGQAERIAIHGNGATVFVPADDLVRVSFLRHIVEAGLPVKSFSEDKARMQEVYFASLGAEEPGKAAGSTEQGPGGAA